MSDAAGKRVSLNKNANKSADKTPARSAPKNAGALKNGNPPDKLPLPQTVQRATIAAGVQILLSLITAAMFWGYDSQLKKLIIDNNNGLGSKAKKLCSSTVTTDCLDVTKSLHSFRTGVTEYTIIASAILIFLIFLIRRGSGAGRWIYLIASVFAYQVGFAGSPMSLFVIGTETPVPLKVIQVIAGVASIVAIVFLLMPASAAYFRATGAALREARGQTGQPRGLFAPREPRKGGGLFAPRPPARQAAPEPVAEAEPAKPKSKAKVRTDAEAVAKGAELARARAKASKSRRSAS